MKRILTTLCALAVTAAMAAPALAAEPAPSDSRSSPSAYPISVEEYLEGDIPRIKKVYQLSLSEDPSIIPTDDFERDGRIYYLLDMTRKDEVGVDAKPHTQTVTLSSNTNDMTQILQRLEGQIEAATEDGYTGVLLLDHTTVKVSADGYTTKTQTLSATRTYPNLSDADLSLIPKSIEEKGKTLTLADVQWASSGESGAERYTATASYGGTSSSRHATGYTVTADYTGQVARTDCAVVTYTAVFGSMEAPEESNVPVSPEPAVTERPDEGETSGAGLDLAALKRPLLIGGVVVLLAAGGIFLFQKIKERK